MFIDRVLDLSLPRPMPLQAARSWPSANGLASDAPAVEGASPAERLNPGLPFRR